LNTTLTGSVNHNISNKKTNRRKFMEKKALCTSFLGVALFVAVMVFAVPRSSAIIVAKEEIVATTAIAQAPHQPFRPVSGGITLGFNKSVSWASKPHNGIDYVSSLGNQIKNVGTGLVYSYTKPNANRFGSINPDGNGPAVWLRYKLASGEPIYVLYGHSASSYNDSSTGSGRNFRFNCTYVIDWRSNNLVTGGINFLKTAPFYNGGRPAPHLHLSVFKPKRKSDGSYYGPPSSGWGYSDINLTEGTYINPEDFLTKEVYKLSPTV
jgi:hypothetical protein